MYLLCTQAIITVHGAVSRISVSFDMIRRRPLHSACLERNLARRAATLRPTESYQICSGSMKIAKAYSS